jgi:hypothetical protein
VRLLIALLACAFSMQAQTIHYVLTLGNSNSSGYYATPVLTTMQPYSNLMLSGSSFIPLTETPNAVEGPMSSDGNQMSLLSSGYVAAVQNNYYLGGAYTDLEQGTATYNAAIATVQTAVTAATALSRPLQAVASIYMAGGTDFGNQVPAATYETEMVALQAALQADVHAKTGQTGVLPLFLDINSKWTEQGEPSETPTLNAGGKGIQFGVLQAWKDHQGSIVIIGPHYQQTFQASGTGADHTDNVSNRNYGEQTGKVMNQVLNTGVPWVPLVPRSITISGATLTFRCWVPSATSLTIDTTSVPNWSGTTGTEGYRYLGFEFYDNSGTSPHITAVAVASADTLTLTLASAPTGAATSFRLRYDYTGTINTIQGTLTAPGGNIRDSDAATGVSGGDHLFNWLIGPMDEAIPFQWSPTPLVAATGGIVQ